MPYATFSGQPPFVGRAEQLERLRDYRMRAEGALDTSRHCVLIEGYTGVGTTALGNEFLGDLNRDGNTFTLAASYSPGAGGAALAPLFESLDRLLQADRFVARRMQPVLNERMYAGLLAHLPVAGAADGELSDDLTEQRPEQTAGLLAATLRHLSRSRPVVVFIDDVDQMPDDDLAALGVINQSLRDAPVLVVLALRSDAPDADRVRSQLRPMFLEAIELAPLDVAEVGKLVAGMSNERISSRLARHLHELSDGSPAGVLDLLRSLAGRGELRLVGGDWQLNDDFSAELLDDHTAATDRLAGVDSCEHLLLVLLDCVGGTAGEDELTRWLAMLDVDADVPGLIDGLRGKALLKSVFARPGYVRFVHSGVAGAVRSQATSEEIDKVVRVVTGDDALRRDIRRWMSHEALGRAVLEQLPPPGSAERAEIIDQLTPIDQPEITNVNAEDIYRVLRQRLEMREQLLPREVATTQFNLVRTLNRLVRYGEAIAPAEQLVELTQQEASCRDMRALALNMLARIRFNEDRTTDISDLLQQAEAALPWIESRSERMYAELDIAFSWMQMVTSGSDMQKIIEYGERLYQLADQLGLDERKYDWHSTVVLATSRLHDHSFVYRFSQLLLSDLHRFDRTPPNFYTVAMSIRSAMVVGSMFLARELFDAWCTRFAPIGPVEYMHYCRTRALFESLAGEYWSSADFALDGIAEYRWLLEKGDDMTQDRTFAYFGLQAQLLTALFASGRYIEATDLIEELIETTAGSGLNIYAHVQFLQLVKVWLGWRTFLPVTVPTSLHSHIPAEASGESSVQLAEALTSPRVAEAAAEYRRLYEQISPELPPQAEFQATVLFAKMRAVEGDFQAASDLLDHARDTCRRAYSWSFDLEHRASSIVLRIRWAVAEPSQTKALLSTIADDVRELFTMTAREGMAGKISHLIMLFTHEASKLPKGVKLPRRLGPLQEYVERVGQAFHATALQVRRNSRVTRRGPIDHTRLFMMGPLRLMQPFSYMELSETEFDRETARTLLRFLATAAVLGQRRTREEVAARIMDTDRTPEQMRKVLYNAISAARAACESADSVVTSGGNALELNTSLEMPGSVWVDARELLAAIDEGERHEANGAFTRAYTAYSQALALARNGEYAVDCYEPWIDAARDMLSERTRFATLAMGRLAIRIGHFDEGIEAAGITLDRDPVDEEMHRLMMELYAESGNRAAALMQFDKCCQALRDAFDVEPEAETVRLRGRIAGGRGRAEGGGRRAEGKDEV